MLQLVGLAPLGLEGFWHFGALGLGEIYRQIVVGLQVIVVVTNRVVSVDGIGVCALVLVRPLLLLVVVLQGLPSRVCPVQGAGFGNAAHRSTHHGCGVASPPSGLDLRGLLPGVGAVRRRCPETGGERAAQPEYASALGIGGKGRAVLEAPSGPHQVQRITVASGAVTARKDDATATDQAATVKLEVSVFSPFDGGFIQTTSC